MSMRFSLELGRPWGRANLFLVACLAVAMGCGRGGDRDSARTPGTGTGSAPIDTLGAGGATAPEASRLEGETDSTDAGGRMRAATASADIEGRSGSKLTGRATFTPAVGGGVRVVVDLSGAPPGLHGLHLHQNGDCSAADAASAGDHFNPMGHQHGAPGAAEHHAGDFGNIEVGPDGTGHLEITVVDLTLDSGPNSVLGHAIVVHADRDDLKTQPSGKSGARIGCGVVQAAGGTSPGSSH